MNQPGRQDTTKGAAKASSFFTHRQCEAFPCHAAPAPDDFNCLFCYCPLYLLENRCGGQYVLTPQGLKDCSGCIFPHQRENYRAVLQKLTTELTNAPI